MSRQAGDGRAARRAALLAALLAVSCAADAASGGAAPPRVRESLPDPAPTYGREEPLQLDPLERDLLARVRVAAGARVQGSPSLSRAARILAEHAADGVANPLGGVRGALAAAGAFDPAPVAHLASGPADAIGASLASRARENELTHVGVGVVVRGSTAWGVLLTSRRSVRLDPFPRALPPGSEATLRGELLALRGPRVVVTRPSGEVEEYAAEGDRRFKATIRFASEGRHTVEVLGSGALGPEVVALLSVVVGHAAPESPRAPVAEVDPGSQQETEALIEQAVNDLRAQHHLPPLRSDPALRNLARAHSRNMLAAGRVAHVLPGTGDIAARMQRARLPFERVLENVARGPSGIAAHRAAEESPAHRGAMLDPSVTTMGCGVARATLPSGETAVYLTEIFVEAPHTAASAADVADATARIHRLLRSQLAAQDRPALTRDFELDELATEAARAMVRRGTLALPGSLNEDALRLPGRSIAAAEVFIGSEVGDTARSRHLADPRYRRLGVGVATGSSPRYGAQRLWMVLLFTD